MTGPATLALLILAGLVGLIGSWRQRRLRGNGWLLGVLLLQFAIGAVLWQLLHPPLRPEPARPLVVLTANHDGLLPVEGLDDAELRPPLQLAAGEAGPPWRIVALPEALPIAAGVAADVERVPDLASALRAAPASRLIVFGDGLPARDRGATSTLPLHHRSAPAPSGIVELDPPPQVQPGAYWRVRGRIAQSDAERWQLRLLDPASVEQARVHANADGRFELVARTAVEGRHLYRVELLDASGAAQQALALPLHVQTPPPLRLVLHAAAVNPENKYLRRWAVDAGLAIDSRLTLRPGLALGSAAAGPGANLADWASVDLLIIEDRVWRSWRDADRLAVRLAVDEGMGLLLRLTEAPTAQSSALYNALGFGVLAADLTQTVRLPPRNGLSPGCLSVIEDEESAAQDCGPAGDIELSRRPVEVQADQAAPLLSSAAGEPLGLWRASGLGRIGLLWLSDSYKLALANDPTDYADRWSGWVATLARAGQAASSSNPSADALPTQAWLGERSILCGPWTEVIDADGGRSELLADASAESCRGFWPRVAGWHRLVIGPLAASTDIAGQSGAAVAEGSSHWIHVRDPADAVSLHRQQTRDWMHAQTSSIALDPAQAELRSNTLVPGPRWPWWLAFWILASALWWLERPARSQAVAPRPQ